MDRQPTKPGGPLLWLAGNGGLRRITALSVLMMVLYVAGDGPASLFRMRAQPDVVTFVAATFYWPLDWCETHGPDWLASCLRRFRNIWRRGSIPVDATAAQPLAGNPHDLP